MSPNAQGHLAEHCYALVLAGGRGSRLHQLTDWRAKPALPLCRQAQDCRLRAEQLRQLGRAALPC